MLVAPAPIPPHERPWRHPSELAPTSADLPPDPTRRGVPLVVGSVAVLVVAVLVVAMTPRPGRDDGAATTATTSPLIVASVLSSARAEQGPDVKLATFSPIPNVVAASPTVSLDGVTIASHLPSARETVIVQTEFETYRVAWRDVQWLELDGLALVADRHLALVGYLDHGEFHSMIAD